MGATTYYLFQTFTPLLLIPVCTPTNTPLQKRLFIEIPRWEPPVFALKPPVEALDPTSLAGDKEVSVQQRVTGAATQAVK